MAQQNYGLLNDMAGGIKEGLIAYQTTKKIKQDQQMLGLLHGVQTDENGNASYTPQKQMEMDAQRKKLAYESQQYDPNSEASKASAGFLAKLSDGKIAPEDLAQMPAAEQKQFLPAFQQSQKSELANEIRTDRKITQKDKIDEKSSQKQKDSLKNTMTLLETTRSNPAAAQAEKDIYAADKAKSLANLYGDPNKLSNKQVNMLVSELGKMASGGVPSMHELDGISPGALQGALSDAWSKLSNKPTPANAGAFIKQYMDYANALTKDAHKFIQDRYGRIIDTSRKNLGEENYSTLTNNYLHRFDVPESAESPKGLLTPPNGGHPQDQEAIQWAKKNPNDPMSAAILKANGQ